MTGPGYRPRTSRFPQARETQTIMQSPAAFSRSVST